MKKLTLTAAALSLAFTTSVWAEETTQKISKEMQALSFPEQDSDELYNWREKEGVAGGIKISNDTVSDCTMANSYSQKHYRTHYKHKTNCKK